MTQRRPRQTLAWAAWPMAVVVLMMLPGSAVSAQGQAPAPDVFLAVGAGFPWDFTQDHLSPAGIVTQVRARKGVNEKLRLRGVAEWSRFGEDETGTGHLHAPCQSATNPFGCHVSLTDRNGIGWHIGGGFEGKGSHPSFIELQFHQTHGVDRSPTAGRVFQVMYGAKL